MSKDSATITRAFISRVAAMLHGLEQLHSLGALDLGCNLTATGEALAELRDSLNSSEELLKTEERDAAMLRPALESAISERDHAVAADERRPAYHVP